MNLKDCYKAFGGNFDEVLGRLRREPTIQKFVFKFLDDKSFQLLESSLETGNYEEALRAVHTLKGICQNLSFTRLYEYSSQMNEDLKAGNHDKAIQGMPQLSESYFQIVNTLKEYKKISGEA